MLLNNITLDLRELLVLALCLLVKIVYFFLVKIFCLAFLFVNLAALIVFYLLNYLVDFCLLNCLVINILIVFFLKYIFSIVSTLCLL
jgi:hypothetical protein